MAARRSSISSLAKTPSQPLASAPPPPPPTAIRLFGVRQNNLKNFNLDIPLGKLVVVTGLSGSGKSSLAFDTLYAEGQRRYIETFSPYARQFFDRMDKPAVDRIENIPPAIAIEQRNSVRSTRSTVGTMTEICEHMKQAWPHISKLHCRQCRKPVRPEPPSVIWESIESHRSGEGLITFDVPLTDRLTPQEQAELLQKQGYVRVLFQNQVLRIEDWLKAGDSKTVQTSVTVVQDRLRFTTEQRARFMDAAEQAYRFGKNRLRIWDWEGGRATHPQAFSSHHHCAECDIEYSEPTTAKFSFNNPVGACPECKGFGRIIAIDPSLAIPDRSKTLAQGAVKPWQSGASHECQGDLEKTARKRGVPLNVPFRELSADNQKWVMEGDPGHGKDADHEWPRSWYGVKGFFRWLESKSYKMHVRVLLSRYRSYRTCHACDGNRFHPDTLLHLAADPARISGRDAIHLSDFYRLDIDRAALFLETLMAARPNQARDPVQIALSEVRQRIGYLREVGLGYLSLDRQTRTLSGGETERVNLTTCLGSRLVNTLFVLDEPSVGLHPRDTDRLIRILHRLRDHGNTVLVVEHETSVMRAADRLIDLGPGHGDTGGEIVFEGSADQLPFATRSHTADYLTGKRSVPTPLHRPIRGSPEESARSSSRKNSKTNSSAPSRESSWSLQDSPSPALVPGEWLQIRHASRHNLRDIAVDIPLGRLVAVTGVSGSGKTTLVREILLPALDAQIEAKNPAKPGDSPDEDAAPSGEMESNDGPADVEISGCEHLGAVLIADQSSLGRTPRSNPAVYIGAFEDLRDLFAATPMAREREIKSSSFSYNSRLGQCEKCRGAGFEKIEMQFLSDIYIRCPECNGSRYRPYVLEITIEHPEKPGTHWNLADILNTPIEEVVPFLTAMPGSKPARRACEKLQWLLDVGLGYLQLGQPINTLSGGESQRLKLVRHLVESGLPQSRSTLRPGDEPEKPTLFIFDEPTTGLHIEDVRILLEVFHRLVDAGHSILVVEHHLDVIRNADWVIDLGPEAGADGGRIVACGTPEEIAACPESHTGRALAQHSSPSRHAHS